MAVTVTLEAMSAPGVWTDITADLDLNRSSLKWSRAISGFGPTDRLQRPGFMSFALDNSNQNFEGRADYYTPDHANSPSWWRRGILVRLRLQRGADSRYVFRGTLRSILPEPPIAGPRVTTCLAADWLEAFAKADASNLALREDVRSDELLQDLIDLVETPPANVDLDTGLDVYPFAFDDLGGGSVMATELAQDVLQSELGYLYLRGDATDGETLRAENRHARAVIDAAHTFAITDLENVADVLEAPSTLDAVFNDIEVLTVPRRPDAAATSILISLDSPIEVGAGQTETLFVDYKDPANEAAYVGGTDMEPPSGTIDWTANRELDGSGLNVTAFFTVTATFFGSRAMIEIHNGYSQNAFVRGPGGAEGLQVRGRGLYRYREVSSREVNQASIDVHGRRALPQPLLMPYQPDRNVGTGAAALLAALHGSARTPRRVRIGCDNADPVLEQQAILRDLGDAINIPVAGDTVMVIIHGLDGELLVDGRVRMAYTIVAADTTEVFVLDDPDRGQLDTGGVLAYA